jgi:hypothetical protein
MAATIFETLVMRGIRVVDVLANSVRPGSAPAHGKPPASLSYPRHLPQGFPGQQRGRLNHDVENDLDEDCVVERTGRSGSHAGNLVSQRLASLAGRAVLWGWPSAEGGDLRTDKTRHSRSFSSKRRLSVSSMAPRTPPTTMPPTAADARLTARHHANARRDRRFGTPSVSTRGISVANLPTRQGVD